MVMKVDANHMEVYGPYPIVMNKDGIDIYTKAHLTNVSDQVGRTFIRQEELKLRYIRHNAMLDPDAVHIVCEAGLAALQVTFSKYKASCSQ